VGKKPEEEVPEKELEEIVEDLENGQKDLEEKEEKE